MWVKTFNDDLDKIMKDTSRPSRAKVTSADYLLVSTGQSYEQVKAIFGFEGTELSRSEIKGTPVTILYQWSNPDGSNAIITFQDDKVVAKAQALLK
jgi:hypothetical protein